MADRLRECGGALVALFRKRRKLVIELRQCPTGFGDNALGGALLLGDACGETVQSTCRIRDVSTKRLCSLDARPPDTC